MEAPPTIPVGDTYTDRRRAEEAELTRMRIQAEERRQQRRAERAACAGIHDPAARLRCDAEVRHDA